MMQNPHWLDQVSLPIAVQKLQTGFAALDERYNFPAHSKPLPAELPFLCHYHWPRIVQSEPALLELVRELADQHDGIRECMRSHPEWAALIATGEGPAKAKSRPKSPTGPTCAGPLVLIAGVPASGGDDLLRMIAACPGCVALDDPAGIQAFLQTPYPPWELASHLRQLREIPDAGADAEIRGARNSVVAGPHDGAAATTAQRSPVLAVKEELGFLARLDALKRIMPRARLICCVRDPFETIAEWKAHRLESMIDATMATMLNWGTAWLPQRAWRQLERIASLHDAAEKRAAYWWWMAQRLLDNAQGVHIVRHACLSADPRRELGIVMDGVWTGECPPIDGPVRSTQAIGVLDEHDMQAIRAICAQPALELGLCLDR